MQRAARAIHSSACPYGKESIALTDTGIAHAPVQGERYSMGYFVWPRYSDVMQGPLKKFPAITFGRFMEDKSKGFG